jgi:ribonuclease R
MNIEKKHVMEALTGVSARGLKVAELARLMNLDSKGQHRLRRLLEELFDVGEVVRAPGVRYHLPDAAPAQAAAEASGAHPSGAAARGPAKTASPRPGRPAAAETQAPAARPDAAGGVLGRIRVHPAGYGFVERDDGEVDVFVPARYRGTALDGDRVRVTTWLGVKGTEGRVDDVVERGRAKLTGLVREQGHQRFLEPDDPRIASTYGHVMLEDDSGLGRPGTCVVAEITRYPTHAGPGATLAARVVHVLGPPDDPRTEVAKVIACAEIPDVFPEDTLAAAKRTSQELRPADFADRIDLRDRPFLTIDPETARDFDDAICVETRGTGFRIWVAVADVSHYVTPGSALDREARVRGCSVYLPDRAIPMLPKELSSGICSINPEVDRCAMVVRIDVDAHGGLVAGGASFAAAVIRSHARLDYPGVAAALAGDFRGPRARYQMWAGDLKRMHELSRHMRKQRLLRGALDFDLPEAKVVLDEDDPRRVRDVKRSKADAEVKQAYQLVEEYMLAANEAVARFFREREADTLWRVHDKPSTERLETFAELARSYGVDFEVEKGQDPKELRAVLQKVAGEPYERALTFLLLRSMKQAQYDVVPIGHFGLASADYLHFTSPIRRYPDLLVHRLLKWHLRQEGLPSGGALHAPPPARDQLAAMAAESSGHERRAAEAEREVVDMYRAFLMRDRVQEELTGVVSAVTSFGVFIEIDDPFVEGMIKLDQLGDEPFVYDEKHMRIAGRRTGRTLKLGDPVTVRVENVSVARRRIDLSLISGGAVDPEAVVRSPVSGGGRGGERGLRPAPGGGGGAGGRAGGKGHNRRAERERGRERGEERRSHGGGAAAGAGASGLSGAKGERPKAGRPKLKGRPGRGERR